jgi:sec-independent protein translocase protein TatA
MIDNMGLDNPIHIAFLLILLLLVFGAKRLPEMGRSLGSGMRGFKDALSGEGGVSAALASQPEAAVPTAPAPGAVTPAPAPAGVIPAPAPAGVIPAPAQVVAAVPSVPASAAPVAVAEAPGAPFAA